MNRKESPASILHGVRNYLKYLSELGCRGFECSAEAIEMLQGWGSGRIVHGETVDDIAMMAKDCCRCQLSNRRQQVVFGSGDSKAKLMFLGDCPEAVDEEQGFPFAGEAGALLTKIIQAMGFTRETVYLCNVVKCRPSEERAPLPEEINACRFLLDRQIQTVQPDIICTLGAVSTHALLQSTNPFSALRGRFHPYGRIHIMPTYHPALLLKDPNKKRDVWEDMKLVMNACQKKESRTE